MTGSSGGVAVCVRAGQSNNFLTIDFMACLQASSSKFRCPQCVACCYLLLGPRRYDTARDWMITCRIPSMQNLDYHGRTMSQYLNIIQRLQIQTQNSKARTSIITLIRIPENMHLSEPPTSHIFPTLSVSVAVAVKRSFFLQRPCLKRQSNPLKV